MTRESRLENAVIILGGDTVVGQALELLLRNEECNAKFLSELSELERPESLDEAGLLLLAPGLDAERRETALQMVRQRTVPGEVPILELVSNARTGRLAENHFVASWPCQMEDLRRQIKSLLAAPGNRESARFENGE